VFLILSKSIFPKRDHRTQVNEKQGSTGPEEITPVGTLVLKRPTTAPSLRDVPVTDEALKAVELTNELLDEVERLREEWERSREMIESAKQMRIAADGYISSPEKANKALAECVNGALERDGTPSEG